MRSDKTHVLAGAPIMAVLAVLAVVPTASAAPLAQLSKVESPDVPDAQPIVLDEREAKRLGVQTTPVREEKVLRQMTVIGEVEDESVAKPSSEPGGDAAASGPVPQPAPNGPQSQGSPLRVLVLLDKNPDDDDDDDAGQYDDEDDAEILAPGDFDEDEPLRAKRIEISAGAGSAANTLYFKIRGGTQHGLTPGQRVGVKLAAPGSDVPKRVVPYSAIFYDPSGNPSVYVSPKPLEFVRQPVTVEDINQGMAVLSDGPPAGTEVVTVGAAELAGADAHAGR
ncbi:hypothetical protein [Methyloceanibacter sp.]|uniref:hypothetical protein n=1 Tax=Methyloceanibacter sp. TaxID=1965321 RepID=UPI003D6D17AF